MSKVILSVPNDRIGWDDVSDPLVLGFLNNSSSWNLTTSTGIFLEGGRGRRLDDDGWPDRSDCKLDHLVPEDMNWRLLLQVELKSRMIRWYSIYPYNLGEDLDSIGTDTLQRVSTHEIEWRDDDQRCKRDERWWTQVPSEFDGSRQNANC